MKNVKCTVMALTTGGAEWFLMPQKWIATLLILGPGPLSCHLNVVVQKRGKTQLVLAINV